GHPARLPVWRHRYRERFKKLAAQRSRDPQPPDASARVEAGRRLVSVRLVVGVRGCPVPGRLERGDDIPDGPGVRAEDVVTGIGAVAALEVPPHDPVVEYPAVRAGQL